MRAADGRSVCSQTSPGGEGDGGDDVAMREAEDEKPAVVEEPGLVTPDKPIVRRRSSQEEFSLSNVPKKKKHQKRSSVELPPPPPPDPLEANGIVVAHRLQCIAHALDACHELLLDCAGEPSDKRLRASASLEAVMQGFVAYCERFVLPGGTEPLPGAGAGAGLIAKYVQQLQGPVDDKLGGLIIGFLMKVVRVGPLRDALADVVVAMEPDQLCGILQGRLVRCRAVGLRTQFCDVLLELMRLTPRDAAAPGAAVDEKLYALRERILTGLLQGLKVEPFALPLACTLVLSFAPPSPLTVARPTPPPSLSLAFSSSDDEVSGRGRG